MHTKVVTNSLPSFDADDRIVLGEGLFETLKVEHANPCFAALHWQRLRDSAQQLGIPFDLTFEHWHDHLIIQIKQDNLYHGGIKVILSGGAAPRGLTEQGQISHMVMQTFNYPTSRQPLRLMTAPWLRDGANPVYQMKTVNYLEAILARRQAHSQGVDDALFFNLQAYATETTCANFFLLKNNEVVTPRLADGVLPGITRARLFELCAEEGIACVETGISRTMIAEADAVFTTNSLQGIRCVLSLDELAFTINHVLLERLTSLMTPKNTSTNPDSKIPPFL